MLRVSELSNRVRHENTEDVEHFRGELSYVRLSESVVDESGRCVKSERRANAH